MKVTAILLTLLYATSAVAGQPYVQPIEPSNADDVTLIPAPGGKINLDGETFFKLKDGKKRSLPSLSESVDSNVKAIGLLRETSSANTKGIQELDQRSKRNDENTRNKILSRDLNGYIDFEVEKSHVGEFYGAKRSRIEATASFDDDILSDVPSDSDHIILRDFNEESALSSLTIGGKAPKSGRNLTVTNLHGAKHLPIKLGCSNCVSKGPGSPDTIYIEPHRSIQLIYFGGMWQRIGAYRGVRGIRTEGYPFQLMEAFEKKCENARTCWGYCSIGKVAVSPYCSSNAIGAKTKVSSNNSKRYPKGKFFCQADQEGTITLEGICLDFSLSD